VPELSLRGVSKVYGGTVVALDRVDLELSGPHLLGVVGPSGSGKTTLLRVIAGLAEPSSGHIVLDGQVIDDWPARDRDVALMFQEHTLFPHMTVRANLGFGLRLRRVDDRDARLRIADAAATLGLEPLLERYPDQLSGGERQRVALGRTLVRRPRLLLLDEPLSSVDAQIRAQLRVEISRTCRKLGGIVILVTHDQMDAMAISDQIAVMRSGRIEQIGHPRSLYTHPANRFVAQFIGMHGMNLFDGHLRGGDHDLQFVHPEFTFPLPEFWRDRIAGSAPSAITLGLRPENLVPVSSSDGAGAQLIRSVVETIERIGPQVFVHFSVKGKRYAAVIGDVRALPEPGEVLLFRIDPTAVRFFDTVTGQAL
jgi:multiple sugar transport system ATP-binding protein